MLPSQIAIWHPCISNSINREDGVFSLLRLTWLVPRGGQPERRVFYTIVSGFSFESLHAATEGANTSGLNSCFIMLSRLKSQLKNKKIDRCAMALDGKI